ncbi:ankyrin repeat-containing domain protein [Whalleya microplaca]|nr:ankyrin repeat-containing domain protein [Whalleya microplaca]
MCKQPDKNMPRISGWFRCLANAMAYVHGIGITHRDIKPPNILVKGETVLLADFGISKLNLMKTVPTTVPELARARTTKYAAPEVEEGSTRGRSADIFSLGSVFLEMFIAHSRRAELSELKSIKSPSYAGRLDDVQAWMVILNSKIGIGEVWQREMLQLCRRMMNRDRDARPTAEEVYTDVSSLLQPESPPYPCCAASRRTEGFNAEQLFVFACQNGDLQQVKSFLSRAEEGPKALANTVGAIHQASLHGFKDIVQSLLIHEADINCREHSGQTALHCAAGNGHEDIVQLLLNKSCRTDVKDDQGRTPLHYASAHGHLGVVTKLLEATNGDECRIRVADQDGNGQTALHLAAKGKEQADANHEEVIRVLRRHGADVSIMDTETKTPYNHANDKGYAQRACLLKPE